MATKVYGASDDLIEFEGDFTGEANHIGGNDDKGALVALSDGTMLAVKYGKTYDGGIWEVKLLKRGTLFDRIDVCTDADDDPYSDVAHFHSGITCAYAATEWEKVT